MGAATRTIVRALTQGSPLLVRMLLTCTTVHAPPRAVLIPRADRALATPQRLVIPLACIGGRVTCCIHPCTGLDQARLPSVRPRALAPEPPWCAWKSRRAHFANTAIKQVRDKGNIAGETR